MWLDMEISKGCKPLKTHSKYLFRGVFVMLEMLNKLCEGIHFGNMETLSEVFYNADAVENLVNDCVRWETHNNFQTVEFYNADNSIMYSCSCTKIFGAILLTNCYGCNKVNQYGNFDWDRYYSILRIYHITENSDVVAVYAHNKINRIKENMPVGKNKKDMINHVYDAVYLYDLNYITLDEAMEKIAKI